jgi:hypothetical protein
MTDRRIATAERGVTALKDLLVGADPPRADGHPKRRVVEWVLATAGALYLAHGGAAYLDAKSGLPYVLCLVGGVALAGPLLLLVIRPLLAWRVAWLTALVTGVAVQAHQHTPFSWHPAVLALQMVILVVIAVRLPLAVTAWAFVSMAVLVRMSFFPADWVPIMEIVAVVMGIAALIGARRRRAVPA